jgi:acyl dehydratase
MPASTPVIRSAADAVSLAGQSLGTSDWLTVTQQLIDDFARTSGDLQWIHVDPVRAADGPFGGCVAHGLLTLSLAGGRFFHDVVRTTARSGVNYGCDRVRYPAPVPAGSRIRAEALVLEAAAIDNAGVQMKVRITVEVDQQSRPACVADFVVRYYF